MTNPLKGEVSLEADGTAYIIVFDINALCALEDKSGKSAMKLFEALSDNPDLRTLRLLVWAGLQSHIKGLTLDGAGEIMQAVGMAGLAEKLGEAARKAFPAANIEGAGGSAPDPQSPPEKAAAKGGTGSSSTASGESST